MANGKNILWTSSEFTLESGHVTRVVEWVFPANSWIVLDEPFLPSAS